MLSIRIRQDAHLCDQGAGSKVLSPAR